jgi:hypothetical protein
MGAEAISSTAVQPGVVPLCLLAALLLMCTRVCWVDAEWDACSSER